MSGLASDQTSRRIAALPTDKHGRPVPWFVASIDGLPDFRVIGPGKIGEALRFRRCWVCGEHRGTYAAFVIGPMCAVNRTSAEPPAHTGCALYAATHCPFLTTPSMRRRDNRLPEGHVEPPGTMLRRNPGVALVWVSRTWSTWTAPDGGLLFDIGDPTGVHWLAHGRAATRAEVMESINTGLPALREVAEAEEQERPGALAALGAAVRAATALVPAGSTAGSA